MTTSNQQAMIAALAANEAVTVGTDRFLEFQRHAALWSVWIATPTA